MNKFKRNKGITLVALIITVIILLILAVVSIQSVTGDGIISHAKNARKDYELAQEKEGIQLELLEWQLVQKNGTPTLKDYFKEIYGKWNVQLNTDESITVTLANGKKYAVKPNGDVTALDGTATEPAPYDVFETIKPINYGDPIDYNDPAGVDDWKVFYKDDEYLYIITSDYLESSKTPSSLNISTQYTYSAYWKNSYSSANAGAISDNIAQKYRLSWLANNKTVTNDSAKATADLLKESVWSASDAFVYNADRLVNEIKAVGGPTLEMWVASWNDKGYTKIYTNFWTNGYDVSCIMEPTSSSSFNGQNLNVDLLQSIEQSFKFGTNPNGYNDSLYFPRKKLPSYGATVGYYLASPANDGTGSLIGVTYQGYLSSLDVTVPTGAVRPLVAIPRSLITRSTAGELDVNQMPY